jgi:PleD family two-component response regulator
VGRERRIHKRVPFTVDILINNAIMVKGIDISIGGLYVHTGRSFRPGDIVDVTIPLNDQKITVRAEIQHNQEAVGMGIKFIGLTNMHRDMISSFIEQRSARTSKVKTEKDSVLLIEDNDMLRRMHKSKLVLEGFQVIDVDDPMDAIKFLKTETPDLIILNLFIEKMDGFKVLAILRESPQWKDIPVIVFSAKGTQDVIDKVLDAGADEFLVKMMTSPAKLALSAKRVLKRKSG